MNLLLIFVYIIFTLNCGTKERDRNLQKLASEKFGRIPEKFPESEKDKPEIVNLGRKLFFDQRLSVNDNVSCNTCHNVLNRKGGTDGQTSSIGAFGKRGERNAPTVLNSALHSAQFWDGRATSLEEEVKFPITNPMEMAMPDERYAVDKISSFPEYRSLFEKAFPSDRTKINYDNIAKAITAFQRTLRTSDRLDEFIGGNIKAMKEDEKAGMELFISIGCVNCHNGVLLGGNSFRKMGEKNPYDNPDDTGRFRITGKPEDKFVFKVPSLRNIAITSPYFHDGSAKTLDEAVKRMGYLQLGIELKENEILSIVNFLQALTDKEREKGGFF